jgi:hypothetical protein
MNNQIAPICLFVYNRRSQALKTLEALQNNYLASQSDLFIFSDGPKNPGGADKIAELREEIKKADGFLSVTISEAQKNMGLSKSIIAGVSSVLDKYGKVIVLEDDLITSPNFLDFMNQALDFYAENPAIFSISGYTLDLPGLKNYAKDFYTGYRASSWGWGTWADRWDKVDWEVNDYDRFKKDFLKQYRFMRGGSDMPGMLRDQMKGKIDSWAIRWCYDQFNKDMLTIFPSTSKIVNIGFGPDATHTRKTTRFYTNPDKTQKRVFDFHNTIDPEKKLVRQFREKFSILNRLKDKFI